MNTAKYTETGTIVATIDGVEMSFNADPKNRFYRKLLEDEVEIEEYVEPEQSWEEKRTAKISSGGYGSITEQLEMIGEKGITAFKTHIQAVKTRYPK